MRLVITVNRNWYVQSIRAGETLTCSEFQFEILRHRTNAILNLNQEQSIDKPNLLCMKKSASSTHEIQSFSFFVVMFLTESLLVCRV